MAAKEIIFDNEAKKNLNGIDTLANALGPLGLAVAMSSLKSLGSTGCHQGWCYDLKNH